MAALSSLCTSFDEGWDANDWQRALASGQALWKSMHRRSPQRRVLRHACARTLTRYADLLLQIQKAPGPASQALQRAYALAWDDAPDTPEIASLPDGAAHRLGLLYEQHGCHRAAAHWFRISLDLARRRGHADHILDNLARLAGNAEFHSDRALVDSCYDELLTLAWPCRDADELAARSPYLLAAGMYKLDGRQEDVALEILTALIDFCACSPEPPTHPFLTALSTLGDFHIARGRIPQAKALATVLHGWSARFPHAHADVRGLANGLTARACIAQGDFGGALQALAGSIDLTPGRLGRERFILVENIELWLHAARIWAHQQNNVGAARAYEVAARRWGEAAGESDSSAMRLALVQEQGAAVHELVSVWLSAASAAEEHQLQPTVANALLQLKANQFLANAANRLHAHRHWWGLSKVLFDANRQLAAAARRMAHGDDGVEHVLQFEDALLARNQIEGRMTAGSGDFNAALAQQFGYDFRELQMVRFGSKVLFDYSLVEIRPPVAGSPGSSQGERYVGVRLSADELRVVDLGPAYELDRLCHSMVSECARPLADGQGMPENTASARNLGILRSRIDAGPADPMPLARRIHDAVIGPLGPIGARLVIAPAGSLGAIPFHALVCPDGRYLIEACEISCCHSLLKEEDLYVRQLHPAMRLSEASTARAVVLMGDPDYSSTGHDALGGTKVEIDRIAQLFVACGWNRSEIHVASGSDAQAAALARVEHPKVLHVAAHGTYAQTVRSARRSGAAWPRFGSWRRRESLAAESPSKLDAALLDAVLVLSADASAGGDPAAGRHLTALEISSMNLLASGLVVLSACETGVGVSDHGAGVLGFQYALSAAFARQALVSLWRVPDFATAQFMETFYTALLASGWDVGSTYAQVLRAACRRQGEPVHPSLWAAFVYLGAGSWSAPSAAIVGA